MTRALKGLASTKLLPVWVLLLAAGLITFLTLLPTVPVLAEELDQDSDGASDALEISVGSDPLDADSDDDNLTDGQEILLYGTSPLLMDTDLDGTNDDVDENPLVMDATDEAGKTNVTLAYDTNLVHEPIVGTGVILDGVNANSGEFLWSTFMDFGPSVLGGRAGIKYVYRSGVSYDGFSGRNVFSNIDHWITVQGDNDVEVYFFGQKGVFDEDQGSYTAPAGWPFTLTTNGQNGNYLLKTIRGGLTYEFDDQTGFLSSKYDRFANTETYYRNAAGRVTYFVTAEGLTITASGFDTERYSGFSGPGSRSFGTKYNCGGDLAQLTDPESKTLQILQIHGSQDPTLEHNIILMMDPMGRVLHQNEYDENDRVVKKMRGEDEFTFDYDTVANKTTVFDWVGNKAEWYWGSPVPVQLVVFSNRNVNSADPTTWTTNFTYNSNYLRTKTVFPRGNSIVNTWDSNYCLTQKRVKQDDTAQDNATNDLISAYTYGTTYYQLKNTTDPKGNTTTRTHDSLERVTQIGYPTITHPNPDVTITESMAWNSNGTLDTFTDGEGNVTKYEYYTTGNTKNLLWKVTKDYGTGKLNLTTSYGYSSARYKTSMQDPDGNTWTYAVDDRGLMTKETSPNPLNYETDYTYNSAGQLTQKDVENVDKDGARVTENPWWTTTYAYPNFRSLSPIPAFFG